MYDFDADVPAYGDALDQLRQAVRRAVWTSIQAEGRDAGERRFWSSVLLTRIVTTSHSLLALCPTTKEANSAENWDFATIASITRNLFEAATFFRYFTAPVEGDEWRARLNLMQLNDCTHRIKVFNHFADVENAARGGELAEDLRKRLESNTYFQKLDSGLQKTLLTGNRPSIYTLREMVEAVGADPRIWGVFEFYSSQTHTLPMSFYRMHEHGRTGVANPIEALYIAHAMAFSAGLVNNLCDTFEADFADLVEFKPLPLSPKTTQEKSKVFLNRAQRRAAKKGRG
jgi:hypothetical protein